jgi:RND superfamily putative drug exporter
VAASAVAVLAAAPAALRLPDELSSGGFDVPGSESQHAKHVIDHELGSTRTQELFVVVPREGGRLRSRAARAARAIRGDRHVRGVAAPTVSRNGRTALVPFQVAGRLGDAEHALPGLRERLRGVGGAEITGKAAILDTMTDNATDDLSRTERLTFPITMAVLSVAFLSLVAAGLPLLLAVVSLTITLAALLGLTQLIETNVFVTNTASVFGLGLSIDYSLFMVSRYREQRAEQGDDDAQALLEATMRTAGRAIAFSGVTVGISLGSLLVIGVDVFTSMAVAAALSSLIAALTALTLLPAVLAMLGPRIDRLSISPARRAAERARLWRQVARFVLRVRVAAVVGVALVLLVMAAPTLDLDIAYPGPSELLPDPGAGGVATATHRLARDFGSGALAPVEVVTRDSPERVRRTLAADPGVRSALPPAKGRHGWYHLRAIGRDEDNTGGARETVSRLRETLSTRFPGTLVGGQTAEGEDVSDRIVGRFPLVILWTAVLTFVVLFVAFRSLVVPAKAVATNMLAVGASLGLVTAIFQWAGGSDSITHFVPPLLFATLFGLSMDYEVFLISRIREAHLAGASGDESVARGLVRSARPITLGAIVMATVFGASATSEIDAFKQLGIGSSLAVILDATLVRCLLVPAAMVLLGRRNWWAPRFLLRALPAPRAPARGPT